MPESKPNVGLSLGWERQGAGPPKEATKQRRKSAPRKEPFHCNACDAPIESTDAVRCIGCDAKARQRATSVQRISSSDPW